MANSAEEAKKAVLKCYPNLLELLPINKLVECLFSRELLSFDRKSELDSIAPPKEKIKHFLDAILIPGLNAGYTRHFDQMVIMMKESDDDLIRFLVEKLIPDVSAGPSSAGPSSAGPSSAGPLSTGPSSAGTSSAGTSSAESVSYDHFNIENLKFASCRDVTDAFALLISVFEEKLPATKFEAIRLICLHRAYDKKLHNEIYKVANISDLLKLLLSYPTYLNWMKIDFLQNMAVAARSQVLQDTVQAYSDAVLSKTLGEIWNFIPSFQIRRKFYSEVKAKFHGKNPSHIKITDLINCEPLFAKRIALHISWIRSGSLTITWCILAEEAYQAYLLSLITPQEFNFLQIGPWVVYHPQSVLQELKKRHVMKEDTTLLIGYYYGLLVRDINADLLTDKMSSAGLLTDTEVTIISSGHSVHHRNWLLLESVRHMDVQALVTFSELLQEMWPQIGLQLITALKFESSSVSSQLPVDTSETKQNNVEIIESDRISSSVHILFLCLIDQVSKLVESCKPKLIQQCNNLKASDIHNINLFSADKMEKLSVSNDLFITMLMLRPLFSWSNHSILKALVGFSDEASKLLDKFKSKLDPLEPITSYPIPCLSSNMIPTDTGTYTILAVRCDKELYHCTLQYVYDVQSVMIEKCDITQHCLQLLAVRSDPTILYWTIPKCVVYLINTNVPLHSEYLYSREILEVLVYPDLLLTTGDDVCYGALAFKCGDQLFSQEISDLAITHQRKEIKVEDLWRNGYQKQLDEIGKKYNLLLGENAELQSQLDVVHKQLQQSQVDKIQVIKKCREFKGKEWNDVATQTDMDAFSLVEEDSGMSLKMRIKMDTVEPLGSSSDNKEDAFGLVEEDSGISPKMRIKMDTVEPLGSSSDNKEIPTKIPTRIIHQSIPVKDSDDTEIKMFTVDFRAYDDISIAFAKLFAICQKAVKLSSEEFRTIRNICVSQASDLLSYQIIDNATDKDRLFEILAASKRYCNWMDVKILKVMAIACDNNHLLSLIEDYTDVIYLKPLREVWSCISHVRDEYYSELQVIFGDKDPDNITVGELMKSKPQLAKEIAIRIAIK